MNSQEQKEYGKSLRKKVPRKDQAIFNLHPSRSSVDEMILLSNYDRLPDLIPIRHERMGASPFAFYRGTANIMAHDLHKLPNTDLKIQSVGDCHLMNFGGFATPERTLIFDVNDFDETNPATWEWDLKRLATSFVLATRHNNLKGSTVEDIVYTLIKSYQKNMAAYSEIDMLDLWYMKFDLVSLRDNAKKDNLKEIINKSILEAQKKTQQKVFYKITQQVLGSFEITDQPPLVYHPFNPKEIKDIILTVWEGYLNTLQADRRFLLSHYKIVDIALKVVGVGSVGTRCYVILLMNEKNEPLFIQVKEARPSILEAYTEKSIYAHPGQRVVEGQRLIQSGSDIFLGWSKGPHGRNFYFRQLKDKKISPEVELFDTEVLTAYARLCGQVLARVHAKTGCSGIISSYMGQSDLFCEAITSFAKAYANQTEIDFEQFNNAIKSGKTLIAQD